MLYSQRFLIVVVVEKKEEVLEEILMVEVVSLEYESVGAFVLKASCASVQALVVGLPSLFFDPILLKLQVCKVTKQESVSKPTLSQLSYYHGGRK